MYSGSLNIFFVPPSSSPHAFTVVATWVANDAFLTGTPSVLIKVRKVDIVAVFHLVSKEIFENIKGSPDRQFSSNSRHFLPHRPHVGTIEGDFGVLRTCFRFCEIRAVCGWEWFLEGKLSTLLLVFGRVFTLIVYGHFSEKGMIKKLVLYLT